MKKPISILLIMTLVITIAAPQVAASAPTDMAETVTVTLLDRETMDSILGGQTRDEPDPGCVAAIAWLVFYATVGAVGAAATVTTMGATALFWWGYIGGWGSVFTSIAFGCGP